MNRQRCGRRERHATRRSLLAGAGVLALASGAAFSWPAAAQEATPAACATTTAAENAAVARRWYDEVFSGHDLDVLDELLSPEAAHVAAAFPDQPDPRAIAAAVIAGFPDLHTTVDQMIASGDQVAARWTSSGTQTGEFQGIAPTGRHATWSGITVFRFACGRIVTAWTENDELDRLRQLGVLPAVPAAMATPAADLDLDVDGDACPAMSADENRAVVDRWFGEAVNPHQLDLLGEIVRDDALLHATGFPDAVGPESIAALFSALFTGFPDLQFTVEPGPAAGDLVVQRWTASGRSEGVFQGIAPTRREVTWDGINIYRVACGQVAEIWTEADTLHRLRQLGVLPEPAGRPTALPTA